jgi:CDP-glucose 4,6-dehydratase
MTQKYWEDKPVLITGATGLLGTALVKELVKNKAHIVCLLRDWIPQSELLYAPKTIGADIVTGDITDQPLIERILGEYEIETVFHVAAQTIVGVANRNPISTFESNIKGTWTILEACRRSPAVNSVLVASSDKAYGSQELPYTEDKPLKGIYPYDVSKACADMIAQSYAKTYGLPVCITRCANFYGPGDLNWNRLIPGTIRSIIRKQPIIIRSDGTSVRDYLYIEDAAHGYMLIAKYLDNQTKKFAGEAFNLSTETPISTLNLVEKIRFLMKSDVKIEVKNKATNEIQEQWLTSLKALREVGWSPVHTLNSGLNETIAWYREFLT